MFHYISNDATPQLVHRDWEENICKVPQFHYIRNLYSRSVHLVASQCSAISSAISVSELFLNFSTKVRVRYHYKHYSLRVKRFARLLQPMETLGNKTI